MSDLASPWAGCARQRPFSSGSLQLRCCSASALCTPTGRRNRGLERGLPDLCGGPPPSAIDLHDRQRFCGVRQGAADYAAPRKIAASERGGQPSTAEWRLYRRGADLLQKFSWLYQPRSKRRTSDAAPALIFSADSPLIAAPSPAFMALPLAIISPRAIWSHACLPAGSV